MIKELITKNIKAIAGKKKIASWNSIKNKGIIYFKIIPRHNNVDPIRSAFINDISKKVLKDNFSDRLRLYIILSVETR